MNKPFNLRLWVVVVSLTAIILVNAALGFTLSRYISSQIIARDGQLSQEFLNSILKAEHTADILFDNDGANPALASFAQHVRNLPGLLRANIYSPDLVIRFSTDPKLVGTTPPEADDLKEALDGKIITGINSDIGDGAQAKAQGFFGQERRVIEAYVPVNHPGGGVVAVVEFYRDTDSLNQILSSMTLIVWGAAGIGGLILFITLFIAVSRASRIIDSQTSQLQSMSVLASLGQMAASVAHSLRNPLASIRSSVDLMRIQHPELPQDISRDITSEIDRIDHHIHDLLDYARTESAQAFATPVAPILTEAIDRMRPKADRQGVGIVLSGLQDASLLAVLEPRLFLQVVESIVTNALQAMPEGGTLTVTLSPSNGQRIQLWFEDTGPGIPPDILARLPEPFLTTKLRGLGLGLSIAARLLDRFGATLRIENVAPHGARVTVDMTA